MSISEFIPQRFMVTQSDVLDEAGMAAIGALTDDVQHDDPREVAAALIVEGLARRGLTHFTQSARALLDRAPLPAEVFPGGDDD